MDSCPNCNAPLSPGTAFCKECGAPLIRVAVAAPPAPPPPLPLAEVIPAIPEPGFQLAPGPRVVPTTQVDWSSGLSVAALAGILGSLLMMVPFGAFGPAMLAAGAFSVFLYRRRVPGTAVTPTMGAKLGLLSGGFGVALFTIVSAIATIILGPGRLRQAMAEALEKSRAGNPDPQIQQTFDFLLSPQGLVLAVLIGTLIIVVMSLIFSSAGGALAASLLERRKQS